MLNKKVMVIGLSICMLLASAPTFAATKVYRLDDAINQAIEVNADLRALESSIPQIEEGVRQANFGASQQQLLYKKYKVYRAMYNDSEDTWDKYQDLSENELSDELVKLGKKMSNPAFLSKMEEYLEDVEYIQYALMFGTDEPDLTEREVYQKYVRGSELIGLQAENEMEKALNNIDVIKGNVTVGVTQAFLGVQDLDVAIKTQNDLLILRNKIQNELEAMYNEGLVSEFDLYSSQNAIETLKLQIEILELQKQNTEYALNNLLGNDYSDRLVLLAPNESEEYEVVLSLQERALSAVGNNTQIKGYKIDLSYYEKDFSLYKEFEGIEFGNEYDDLTYNINRLEDSIHKAIWNLESNVLHAVGTHQALKKEVEDKQLAYDLAVTKLSEGVSQYKLGLVKTSDVHSMQIDVQSKKMALDQAIRAVEKSEIKMDMQVEYGITY